MGERLYPNGDALPLDIRAFYGGADRGPMIQLTGDQITQLTEEQVQALVDVLTDWLYERKVYRASKAIREHLGTED